MSESDMASRETPVCAALALAAKIESKAQNFYWLSLRPATSAATLPATTCERTEQSSSPDVVSTNQVPMDNKRKVYPVTVASSSGAHALVCSEAPRSPPAHASGGTDAALGR